VTEGSGDSRTPALFGHCVRVYDAMMAEAHTAEEAGVTIVVWEGFPTKLIMEQLKLSTPYYTYSLRALKAMGCARQLRRGGSSTPSQWELIKEPTLAAFQESNVKEPSASELRLEAIEQSNRDLNRRMQRLELAAGVSSHPIDYISDPTPPGGIRVREFKIDHDPGEWVDELDNEPGMGIVDN
jgi:hypothetical protein